MMIPLGGRSGVVDVLRGTASEPNCDVSMGPILGSPGIDDGARLVFHAWVGPLSRTSRSIVDRVAIAKNTARRVDGEWPRVCACRSPTSRRRRASPIRPDDGRVDRLRGQQPTGRGVGDDRSLGSGKRESPAVAALRARPVAFRGSRHGRDGRAQRAPRLSPPHRRRRGRSRSRSNPRSATQRRIRRLQASRRPPMDPGRPKPSASAHRGRSRPRASRARALARHLSPPRPIPGGHHPGDRPIDRGDVAAGRAERSTTRPDPCPLGLHGRATDADHGQPQPERRELPEKRCTEDATVPHHAREVAEAGAADLVGRSWIGVAGRRSTASPPSIR